MATPTLADIWQLQQRIPGGVHEDDLARALAALEDASAWIRVEAGEDWLDDDGNLEEVPGAVVSVCCSVARRILDNPDGIMQMSVAQYSEGRVNATTDVYLTKQEKAIVRKAAGTAGGLVAVTLASPFDPPRPTVLSAEGRGYSDYEDWYTSQ